MKINELLKNLHTLAKQQMKVNELREKLSQTDFFNGFSFWGIEAIYPNCTIKEEDGLKRLYSADGEFLSNYGKSMDEEIPYFCNQSVGYCGDDFYGSLFVKVDDKNTFVEIRYEC